MAEPGSLAAAQREARASAARALAELADEPSGWEEAARTELICLWHDLSAARNLAANGVWSMGCDSAVLRIARWTALVGPTPWEQVGIDLTESGLWQEIHAALGVEVPPPDLARVAETRAVIDANVARVVAGFEGRRRA